MRCLPRHCIWTTCAALSAVGCGCTRAGFNPDDENAAGLGEPVAHVAAGSHHTCAITASGRLQCWGRNGDGELGDATTYNRSRPTDVLWLEQGVAAVSCGAEYTCAVLDGGAAKCWGANRYGRLGDGTADGRRAPVGVTGLATNVKAIAAGDNHTCALKENGRVNCWGLNDHGQLGTSDVTESAIPIDVEGLGAAVTVLDVGQSFSCALTVDGGVLCWGYGSSGRLGNGSSDSSAVPVEPAGLGSGVQSVVTGFTFGCALLTGGSVKCWGANNHGQLGDGTTGTRDAPGEVLELGGRATAITAGHSHACALLDGGDVRCWGYNTFGQLGNGSTADSTTPADVLDLAAGAVAVEAGFYHTCARLEDGRLQCWGWSRYGQIGDLAPCCALSPTEPVDVGAAVVEVSAGNSFTCVVTDAGGVKCVGNNDNGRLGDGTSTRRDSFVDVLTLGSDVVHIAGGGNFSCALTAAGGVRCWGDGASGRLGNGEETSSSVPVDVVGLDSARRIAAGSAHTCAVTASGGVKCWGANSRGQLGVSSTANHSAPIDVIGLGGSVSTMAPGSSGDHTCAALDAGGVQCWGSNYVGTLGNGSEDDSLLPVDVVGITDAVIGLGAGSIHTCAATARGAAMCWGYNDSGRLGTGNTSHSYVPVGVLGLEAGVAAISVGDAHACALLEDGRVACWGVNSWGQLGDGTQESRAAPVLVHGLAAGAVRIAAGAYHTCALLVNGRISCWGHSGYGELGRDPAFVTRPIDIRGIEP